MKNEFEIESCIKELESIMEKLTDGKLTFEESLKLYKEGMNLLKTARKQLDMYQHEIEIIDVEDND